GGAQSSRPAHGLRAENIPKTARWQPWSKREPWSSDNHAGRNEMRKVALIAALVLVGVPAGAMAAQPSHPATPASTNANSHANATSTTGTSSKASTNAQSAKVMFILHGTLGAYTPAR